MNRHGFVILMCGLAAIFFPSRVSAAAHVFAIVADGGQTGQIEHALAACPSLASDLDALAKKGTLLRIRITPAGQMVGPGPFSAAFANGEILLAANWLAVQEQPFSDMRLADGPLPDNLCFGLGHLADHLARPMPHGLPLQGLSALVDQQVATEARAFLKGWAYVLEAARIANKGRQLTTPQISNLLFNLRYRFAFLGAMNATDSPKLAIAADGSIPESDANVAAIRSTLAKSNLADLQ